MKSIGDVTQYKNIEGSHIIYNLLSSILYTCVWKSEIYNVQLVITLYILERGSSFTHTHTHTQAKSIFINPQEEEQSLSNNNNNRVKNYAF